MCVLSLHLLNSVIDRMIVMKEGGWIDIHHHGDDSDNGEHELEHLNLKMKVRNGWSWNQRVKWNEIQTLTQKLIAQSLLREGRSRGFN